MDTNSILGVCFLNTAFSSLIPGEPGLPSFCQMEGAFDAVYINPRNLLRCLASLSTLEVAFDSC